MSSSQPETAHETESDPTVEESTFADDRDKPVLQRKPSISEQASARSTRRLAPPSFLKRFEIPFRTKNIQTNQYLEEATGHAMDVAARGTINQTGTFVGAALIRLAIADAASNPNCANPMTCPVYGIRPTSILTVGNIITAVIAGVTMPIMGALVDHTDHRKIMGAASAFIITLSVGLQIMISQDTWFAVYILEIIGGYFLIMHQVTTMAYLPDLTHDLTEMGHYTSMFMIRQYFVQGIYTSTVVAFSQGLKLKNIDTAKLSTSLAFVIGVVLLGYSWTFLFRKRPKLREVPPNSNIFTTGFKQIYVTTQTVFRQYKALKWFMIALLFSPEAGAGTVLAIAVTFLTSYVKMEVNEIATVSLVMLFANIPGALISKLMCRKVNPLNSFRMAEVLFATTNALIAATVTGPERKKLVYFYSALVGVAFGWMFPSQRTLAVAIIPKGQETEIMGLISFFGQVVGWLPAMVFTAMNEAGVNMRWGLSTLSFFLITSCLFTFLCGSFEDAVRLVEHTSEAYLERFSIKDVEVGGSILREVAEEEEAATAEDEGGKGKNGVVVGQSPPQDSSDGDMVKQEKDVAEEAATFGAVHVVSDEGEKARSIQ
ncbi:hypothetical protein ACHAXS_011143 [Conticribra weissflogii]